MREIVALGVAFMVILSLVVAIVSMFQDEWDHAAVMVGLATFLRLGLIEAELLDVTGRVADCIDRLIDTLTRRSR